MLQTLRKILDMLTARERVLLMLLLLTLCALAFANMIGIASIIPFLTVLARPEMIHTQEYLSFAYDALGFESDRGFLIALGVLFIALFTMSITIKAFATFLIASFSQFRAYTIAQRLLYGYLSKPYVWFLDRHSSEMLKLLITETAQTIGGAVIPILQFTSNSLMSLFILGLLVAVDWKAALTAAVVLGVSYFAVFLVIRKPIQRNGRRRLRANRDRFRTAQETLSSFKVIKILGIERSAAETFGKPARDFARATARGNILSSVPQFFVEGVAFSGAMIALLIVYDQRDGDVADLIPIVGVYAAAAVRLVPALKLTLQQVNRIQFNAATLSHVHSEYMAIAREAPPQPAPEALALRDRIEMRDVRFSYPAAERPTLDGLSLTIAAGSSVGFVGGTGAGKTTAIDILLGMIEPESGEVLVDGEALRTDDQRRAWRRSIGYVPQQITLIAGSVKANIAFGADPGTIDMAAVERAARTAQLHDFIMKELPDGYDTLVGEQGVKLSGGQRQRIGLARALYRDPEILVLDEATSALDNLTEAAVMRAIGELEGNKTIVMIAHRLSTIRNCDEIFFMEHGRVAVKGSYLELIDNSDMFRDLAKGAA